MLIEFNVENYKSIQEMQSLGLSAARLTPKYLSENDNLIPISEDLKLLKTKAIYGANASGKSNLYKAFRSFINIVIDIVKNEKVLSEISPFKLSTINDGKPTFMQLIFLLGTTQYRYGFVADNKNVFSEWLFKKEERETELFTREGFDVSFNASSFSEGRVFEEIFSQNSDFSNSDKPYLVLSFIGSILKGKVSSSIIEYLSTNVTVISGLEKYENKEYSEVFIDRDYGKQKMLNLLKYADLGIEDLTVMDLKEENDFKFTIASRNKYDAKGERIGFENMFMDIEESQGTQKMFELGAYIINTLSKGGVLFIDEFDSRFHPSLTRRIVEIFNSDQNKLAQLIFVTHDTNLLTPKLLRRDQISFAEKNRFGSTKVYSLAEFKGVRNDSQFEKEYLQGRYGAIPFLGDFDLIFDNAEEN